MSITDTPDWMLSEMWLSGQIPTDRYEEELTRRLEAVIDREVIYVDFTPDVRSRVEAHG